MLTFHSSRRRCQDGLSLIELMVGMAIGAFIIVGVMYLFTADIQGNRKLIATTRVEQDLRNITDLITRDVRRAGYWGNSVLGTVAIGATAATTSNPYAAMTAASSATSGSVSYSFSRDAVENNTLDANEQFGYQLNTTTGVLQMQTASGTVQSLNDPNFVKITAFSVTDSSPPVLSLGYRCPTVCLAGTPNCPQMFIRRYDLVLTATSALDSTVVRTMNTTIRARNDQTTRACS